MGLKILSCYDGMACGMIAMLNAGMEIDRYIAYEIDKYAVKTATHNFPMIEEMGDVFNADFTEYQGFDFLIGGSPCTYWSIAQKNNRETEASGLGWELFSQYVRALHEAKPKYFIYENNKSMSKAIRDSIRETFGFEEICINSALVSAQNRQRYYWVGKRNEDGTYSKVDVEQPEDRGILLKDVLDNANYLPAITAAGGKSHCLVANYYKGFESNPVEYNQHHQQRAAVAEPIRIGTMPQNSGVLKDNQATRIYSVDGKTTTQSAQGGGWGAKTGLYAVPCCVAQRGRYASGNRSVKVDGGTEQFYEARPDEKTSTLTTVQKDNMVAEPINVTANGKSGTLRATCYKDGIRNIVGNNIDRKTGVAQPVKVGELVPGGQGNRIYSTEGKAVTQQAQSGGLGSNTGAYAVPMAVDLQVQGRKKNENGEYIRVWEAKDNQKSSALTTVESRRMVAEPSPQYATPCEWDESSIPTKAVSGADGKTYTVYSVVDGQITIKEKTYPIKLIDGYYIIRKLTVSECKRLQTVPDWYEFPVSNTQAYKMLGNGWTCDVIAHLIQACFR